MSVSWRSAFHFPVYPWEKYMLSVSVLSALYNESHLGGLQDVNFCLLCRLLMTLNIIANWDKRTWLLSTDWKYVVALNVDCSCMPVWRSKGCRIRLLMLILTLFNCMLVCLESSQIYFHIYQETHCFLMIHFMWCHTPIVPLLDLAVATHTLTHLCWSVNIRSVLSFCDTDVSLKANL